MESLSTSSRWLKRARTNPGARFRLFCFPYAGGGASIFHQWAELLPDEIEVCAVQLPGRENRIAESPFADIRQLVGTLATVLDAELDSKPFGFFGHSMGSFISFELARELRRRRRAEPQYVFMSAQRAPQLADRHPPVHHLATDEFIARLRSLDGTPEEVLRNPEMLEIALPLLRADFALCETYHYDVEVPLACPLSAFGGVADDEANHAELDGWRIQTQGQFRLRMLPGSHFFLQSARPLLLRAIAHDLQPFLI